VPYITNQGVKIHYEVEGAGPPLVMLSGAWGSTEDMYDSDYVDKLKNDFQLILIDFRGHGASGKPHDANKYSMKLFAEDIIAVLDKLAIPQFHIYAHSMGGWFIYGLYKFHPNRLLSIIVADSVPYDSGGGFREVMGAYEEFINSLDSLTPAQKERRLTNDKEAFLAMADWMDRDILEMKELFEEVIKEIDIPCLVLTSNLPEESEVLMQMNKAAKVIPNAELVAFGELSHLDLFFRSDITLPIIMKFLAKANKV
jgi:pimeloyl-ACP methyl ester carboxylesterase